MGRRITTAVLSIAIAAAVGCSGSAAQTPDAGWEPPEPGFSEAYPEWPSAEGGRVEVLGQGIAATFPDDWIVRWYPLAFEPELNGLLHTDLLMAEPVLRTGEGCYVSVSRVAVGSLDRFMEAKLDSLLSSLRPYVSEPFEVTLPAGRSLVFKIASPTTNDGWHYAHAYHFRNDDYYFMLSCFGPELPDDDWLSIAETFEFLPTEE